MLRSCSFENEKILTSTMYPISTITLFVLSLCSQTLTGLVVSELSPLQAKRPGMPKRFGPSSSARFRHLANRVEGLGQLHCGSLRGRRTRSPGQLDRASTRRATRYIRVCGAPAPRRLGCWTDGLVCQFWRGARTVKSYMELRWIGFEAGLMLGFEARGCRFA